MERYYKNVHMSLGKHPPRSVPHSHQIAIDIQETRCVYSQDVLDVNASVCVLVVKVVQRLDELL